MATLRRLLRIWQLSADTFGDLTYSDATKIGLNDARTAVSLKLGLRNGRVEYATGSGIYVKVAPFVVPRAVAWQLLQVVAVEPVDPSQDPREVTDVRARLWDGSTEFWFTAGAWTAVTTPATQWNTIEEVNANLGEWDPADPIGLVFELSTTDARFSPSLSAFRLLYSVDLVSPLNDWIYGAVVQGIKDNVRPLSDVIHTSDGTTSIDFGLIADGFEEGLTVGTVDAVWNEDEDPEHRNDLLSSYNSGTRFITLSTAPPSGDRLLIRFSYVPAVALDTNQDYDELARTPTITLDRVTVVNMGEAPEDDYIMNVFTNPPMGVRIPAPRRVNISFSVLLSTMLSVDLHRLAEELTRYLASNRVLSSPTTGERATLRITDTFDDQRSPGLSDLKAGSMAFSLENVYLHSRPAVAAGEAGGESAYGISRTGVNFIVATDSASEDLDDYIGGS